MMLADEEIDGSLRALRAHVRPLSDGNLPDDPGGMVAALRSLRAVPMIRADAVDRARANLRPGHAPTSGDVAGKLVGWLVCERLR